MGTKAFSALILMLVCSCATVPVQHPRAFVKLYGMTGLHYTDFKICYSYGCRQTAAVSLTDSDWEQVQAFFVPLPETAEQERQLISRVIRHFEQVTGEKTGIDTDIGGTFAGMFASGQMDCEDEAVNTNIFLLLLQDAHLIQFHRFFGIARRGAMINGWPHMACAIEEIDTGERFVVDSWFSDHGMAVHVVAEALWKSGWTPEK